MGSLVIFIDSLRRHAPLAAQLADALGMRSEAYIPPLGFSANILPLLFRGRTADELGFFNEFGVAEAPRHRWMGALDGLVEQVSRSPFARKLVYGGLARVGFDRANLPFRLIPYFEKCSVSPYQQGTAHPSVMEEAGFHQVLASTVKRRTPERDRVALQAAIEAAEREPRLYLSLNDLDGVSHEAGLETAEYTRHETELREGIEELVRRFRTAHPGSKVVILSDHGMAPVHTPVTVDVERVMGPAGPDRYLYFLDSTLIRIWCYNSDLRGRIEELFHSLRDVGVRVSSEERRAWGMTSERFGTDIFVLNEGWMLSPNFIGRGLPLAMHGYHPDNISQHAVFMTDDEGFSPDGPLRGREPYDALRRVVTGG